MFFSCNNQAQNTIPVHEFEAKLNDKNAVLLDVRTSSEYNTGHIRNSFQADWTNRQQFDDRAEHLDKNKTIYIYCASGSRSASAAEVLRGKGYNVINLEGGLTAWKKAGKAVEGLSEENKMSSDQYNDLINSAHLVMIDYGASWCPPCKKMEPLIEEVKLTMSDKVSVKFVDGGANTSLMTTCKVDALPTFILYQKGKEVWRKQGIVSKEDMFAAINGFQ